MEPKRSYKSQKTKIRGKTLKEPIYFIDTSVEELYQALKESPRFKDKELYANLSKTISKIIENPYCGIKIPRKVWPKEYISNYNITNLWKYDLPNGWRLIYTIQGSKIEIISVIIEWFCHKKYERKFNYLL